MDDLVTKYIALRDKKAEIAAEYKGKIAKLDDILTKIEGVLLLKFRELGVESVRTGEGTAYMSRRSTASVADWDATLDYVKKTGQWQLLEHRVSKQAVQEFKDEVGELPPGINWREEVTVNVRR